MWLKGSHADRVQLVAEMVLQAQHILGHLAHRIRIQRAESAIILVDAGISGGIAPYSSLEPHDQHPTVQAQVDHGLKDVGLHTRVIRSVPAGSRHDVPVLGHRRQMKDHVGPRRREQTRPQTVGRARRDRARAATDCRMLRVSGYTVPATCQSVSASK